MTTSRRRFLGLGARLATGAALWRSLTAQIGAGGTEIVIPRPKVLENWVLESSPSVDASGPWTPVPGAGGDARIPADLSRRFFRLRSP